MTAKTRKMRLHDLFYLARSNKTERKSPCLACTRVKDPEECENKQCKAWRDWFIRRWEEVRKTWSKE